MKPLPKLIFFLGALAVLSTAVYAIRYWGSYARDLSRKPWAYSTDKDAKLLVGRWTGGFTDVMGMVKTLNLEIYEPLTDEERAKKITRRPRRKTGLGSRESLRSFDGIATVKSRLGEEHYDIFGSVEEQDYHRFSLHFIPAEGFKPVLPNLTARELSSANWQGDAISGQLSLTKQDENGHSNTSSEGVVVDGKLVWKDAPEDLPLPVALKRVE
jgi:hypothetical protein